MDNTIIEEVLDLTAERQRLVDLVLAIEEG